MIESRQNNFDFLRLLAAIMVICGHSFWLLGQKLPEYASCARIGVSIFFVISGYLITASWQRSDSLFNYLLKRMLRIFPALILSVGLCLLILGPLITSLSMREYFTHSGTWRFLLNTILVPVFDLPGVFNGQPQSAMNTVYWTLPIEFFCYLIIAALGICRVLRPIIVLGLTAVCMLLTLLPVEWLDFLSSQTQKGMLRGMLYTGQFMIGSLLFLYKPPLKPIIFCLLLIAAIVVAPFNMLITNLILPYLVICFAFAKVPLTNFGKYGDISYGLYLWGVPIQQILVMQLGSSIHPIALFSMTIPLAAICAFMSWHLLEAPVLKLKYHPLRWPSFNIRTLPKPRPL